MACNCNDNTYQHPCAQTPCVTTTNCDCPTNLQTKCSVFEGDDLPCTGIKKNTILTTVLQQLDAFICKLKDDLLNGMTLVNLGTVGARVYKGIDLLGRKEIRRINKIGNLITVTENTNDIIVGLDEIALATTINTNQKTVTVSNIGVSGAEIYDELPIVIGNNINYNFRKIKTNNSGILGEAILKTEITNVNDITIESKRLDSNTLEITSSVDGNRILINTPTISEIPSITINSAYTGTVETGSVSKPFKDIPQALVYFVGSGTNLVPQRSNFRVVIQKGNGYLFTGHFEYNNLNLVLEDGVILQSLPSIGDWLIDLDKYGDVTFDITIIKLGNSNIYLGKNGFRNRGTTINTSGIGAYKIIKIQGSGLIGISPESEINPALKVVFDSNSLNQAGFFNRVDTLTFNISNQSVSLPNSRLIACGGNSILRFDNVNIESGQGNAGQVNQNTKFIEIKGNSNLELNNCPINNFFNISTRFNYLITVSDFSTLFITGSRLQGNLTGFLNILSNTCNIQMFKNLGTNNGMVNFINSSIPVNTITFDENNISQGLISPNIDLTRNNTISVTNTVQGRKIESLVKRTARTGGAGTADDLPVGSAFINTNNNNASTATHYRDIKII